MTLQELIFGALKSLVAGRVYPDFAPEGTIPPTGAVAPYIVYQDVGGGQRVDFLDRTQADKENARVQVTVWAPSRLQANLIARFAAQALIAEATLQASPIGAPHDTADSETGLRGRIQDFSFWTDTPS
jgi:hypothetical protein